MKLRNKETGEIRKGEAREDGIYLYDEITGQWYKYELDLLASGWEYYEEPKEVWYIDFQGVVRSASREENEWFKENEIGNYFETKEEAEKAVEKLKAWKRLKDKGFERVFSLELGDALCGGETVEFKLLIDDKDLIEDIKLLFGGEE
jgi:hypothetical protein